MNKKFIVASIVLFVCVLSSACNGLSIFAAGGYANAELYRYNLKEDSLITLVLSLKVQYPDLAVPATLLLIDGRTDSTDHWYHIYFYDKSRNEILHTWIRERLEIGATNFALVGVNEGLALGHWKEINQDYKRTDNINHMARFENLVLNKLPIKYQVRNNSMLINESR